MIDTQREMGATSDESPMSAVSWGAILAGGVAAAALTLVLLAFGTGLGFATVSPWSNSGISSTTFGIGAGLYLVVVAMLSSTIAGYLAGRLRTRWVGVHSHEVYFRDTAHGFLAWAFATVLSAAVLGSAATSIVSGAASGLAQAGGPAAAQATSSGGPQDIFVDALFRSDPGANRPPVDAASRSEVGRLLATSLREGGDLAAADRTYVARVVSAKTGLPQAEAEKRVSDVITQAKAAADKARKAAMKLALWLAASMLIGAFAASLAATEGGHLRDTEWWKRT